MKPLIIFTIILAVCVCIASSCFAVETMRGSNLTIVRGEKVNDDLTAFGQNITVDGTVSGDFTAFGSMITVPGTVSEDAILGAGSIEVAGTVGDDIRAAGGQVTLSGTITDNAIIAGGTINLNKNGKVGRDLIAAAGNAYIDGVVGRNVRIAAGQVNINGRVNGSVRVFSDSITVGPGGVIKGDLAYTGSKAPQISRGAVVGGKIREIKAKTTEVTRRHPSPVAIILLWFAKLLAMTLVGVIIIAIAPRMSALTAERLIAAPWISLLIGFILLVVVPVLIVIVFATIIGIPLALILAAIYAIILYISRIIAGITVGKWIANRSGRPGMSLYLELIIGLVILAILSAIPILGGIISFLALLFGLGAFAYQRYVHIKESRAAVSS